MSGMSGMYDAIIVGGGVIGAAIFHHLTQRAGQRILLIEKSRIGQGSSGWSGGIVRCFHFDPLLSEMAVVGDRYYRQFAQHTGIAEPLRQCGFVHFIHPQHEAQAKAMVAQLATQIEIAWLTPQQAQARFPQMHWQDLAGAVFEPQAAYMSPVAVAKAWLQSGCAKGGQVQEGVRFERLLLEGGEVAGVETNLGNFHSQRVIICAGAWSAKLAGSAHLRPPQPVRSKAIQLNVFATAGTTAQHPAYSDEVHGIYGRAEGDAQMYLGSPVAEWDLDPDHDAVPDLAHVAATRELGRQRFAWLDQAEVAGAFRRFDGYTDDGRGVVAAADTKGLFWATGFSGGGFKLAPAVAMQIGDVLGNA